MSNNDSWKKQSGAWPKYNPTKTTEKKKCLSTVDALSDAVIALTKRVDYLDSLVNDLIEDLDAQHSDQGMH